ncbi:MAG: glycoside hydrolase [Prosthecobacter sp.]|uniref:sialidase family protein n=1 Tax=Prosthecobacter sp. TaxID=1965333 RepID=UPI0025D49D41|nr:sialidase family protein [Prosthecobacter sp.]MCF7785169.1 glycoside hydrolase [Prosthecobacter sp.]
MISRLIFFPAATLLALASASLLHAQAPTAELVSVEKIWDKGAHNGATDLTRFQNLFYCCFRESDSATKGEGVVHMLISANGKTWVDHVTVSEPGVDLRDPKLIVTPDEKRLYLLCGGESATMGRQTRYATSMDGKVWTPMQKLLSKGDWLWRVSINPADKRFYGACFNIHPNSGGPAPEKEWSLKTYASADGSVWQLSSLMQVPGQPGETTLRFLKDGTALALIARQGGDRKGVIGMAKAPYREWTYAATGLPLGGPNFIELPDGKLIAASRGFGATPGPHMVLFAMTPTSLTPILELPSGGDCSYPGLYWEDDLLHVTYYSSHEGKAAIYYARVKIK